MTLVQVVQESWEHIAEANDWKPEDCLNHRIALKKRDSQQVIKDTFQLYIKHLRALGRHLLTVNEKYAPGSHKGSLASRFSKLTALAH